MANYINRGLSRVKLEQFDRALDDFDRALEVYVRDPFPYSDAPPCHELAGKDNRPLCTSSNRSMSIHGRSATT